MYDYKAKVVRVIDGDSVFLDIDCGFYVHVHANCRLAGIDADPITTIKGADATAVLRDLLPIGDVVYINSRKLDKYGRPLVVIYLNQGERSVNDFMLEKGYAEPYPL